jgi:hypothetical protein
MEVMVINNPSILLRMTAKPLPNAKLRLEKTQYNDAIAISGVNIVEEQPTSLFRIVQFRKKKRSLHEATARKGRKTKNTTSKRNAKNTKQLNGWFLNG